jgi:uroporphyrin-III C-methyltransferase/precorrin-2 dehydrogenase/sirohydrochlorin ferrochelatase
MPSPEYQPLLAGLIVTGRRALVVGGGAVAARKVEAAVTVVAPVVVTRLAARTASGAIVHWPRRYASTDLAGMSLAVAATNDSATNSAVLADCREQGVWCNVADAGWAGGDWTTPAAATAGDWRLALSCGRREPRRTAAAARWLASELARLEAAALMVVPHAGAAVAARLRQHGPTVAALVVDVDPPCVLAFAPAAATAVLSLPALTGSAAAAALSALPAAAVAAAVDSVPDAAERELLYSLLGG